MAIITPPPISALPAAPDPADRTTFNARAYPWSAALEPFSTELAAVADNVEHNAGEAATSASTAATQASNAAASAGSALTQAGNASTSASTAAAYAALATNAANVNGTSATPFTPAIDRISMYYAETARAAVAGMRVAVVSRAATATNWGRGIVYNYNSGTNLLTVDFDLLGPAPAAASDWNIMLEGEPGPGGEDAEIRSLIQTRSSNGTITASDIGQTLRCTANVTLTADSAATLGDGFNVLIDAPAHTATITGVGSVYPGGVSLLQSDGTTRTLRQLGASSGDHYVKMTTGNGHGSTANKIRLLTTTLGSSGTALTGTISASLGVSVTANAAGLYAVTYQDVHAASGSSHGISLNAASLTTSIVQGAFPVAEKLAIHGGATSLPACITVVVRLVAGDVLRPHTDGNPTDTSDKVFFEVRKIGL